MVPPLFSLLEVGFSYPLKFAKPTTAETCSSANGLTRSVLETTWSFFKKRSPSRHLSFEVFVNLVVVAIEFI